MSNRGFNLIELLIVIAIIGILSVIAVPSYTSYQQKSRRSDAHVALLKAQLAMEQSYTANNAYPTTLNVTTSDAGYYDLSVCSACAGDAGSYVLVATAKADKAQSGDTTCKVITLSSIGVKQGGTSLATRTPNNCWS